jgi:hypothetical protein
MTSMNEEAAKRLNALLVDLETKLQADVLAIIGAIEGMLDSLTRVALEKLSTRRNKLAIVLHTPGGFVEIAERIVNVVRHFYKEVEFIIPNEAMSAGTVLAMAGDRIWMDYFSCLGPIDPQVRREGKLVPVLSYLLQWDRFVEKSRNKVLTDAEFLIMNNLDLAELHQFELQRDLSISLLKQWLTTYKFKDWAVTETRQIVVTPQLREQRAEEIATKLMKHDLWGSHGRGLPMKVLRSEVNLKIDDFGADPALSKTIRDYFTLLFDYLIRNDMQQCVQSREFF